MFNLMTTADPPAEKQTWTSQDMWTNPGSKITPIWNSWKGLIEKQWKKGKMISHKENIGWWFSGQQVALHLHLVKSIDM